MDSVFTSILRQCNNYKVSLAWSSIPPHILYIRHSYHTNTEHSLHWLKHESFSELWSGTLHFLRITTTPECGRFIMWRRETAEERVTRLTNDQLLSPESGSVSVITGIQSSPTTFAKKKKIKIVFVFFFSFELFKWLWNVWPKPLCSKTDFCFVNLR